MAELKLEASLQKLATCGAQADTRDSSLSRLSDTGFDTVVSADCPNDWLLENLLIDDEPFFISVLRPRTGSSSSGQKTGVARVIILDCAKLHKTLDCKRRLLALNVSPGKLLDSDTTFVMGGTPSFSSGEGGGGTKSGSHC